MPERENSIAIHTFTHDLLDPMLSTLTGYSRGSFWDLVDEKWFRDCLEYLRTAPQLDLIDLVNYTYDAHLFTNEDKSTYLRRLMSEREREKDYAESGRPIPFHRNTNPTWTTLVRMIMEGSDIDPRETCDRPGDVGELRAALETHLAEREKDPGVYLVVDRALRNRLTNLSTWKEVIDTIATMDHRLMDILYMLAKWVHRYLKTSFMRDVAIRYKEDFHKILSDIPVVTREMIVYRGVSNDYYRHGESAFHTSDVYKNLHPVSTSVDPSQSIRFMTAMTSWGSERTPDCCFKIIHLMPGTPALCVWPIAAEPEQAEILLPPGVVYQIKSHTRRPMLAKVPEFTPNKAVRDEVCWDRVVKRAKRGGHHDPYIDRWVSEIYVDGSELAAKKRKRESDHSSRGSGGGPSARRDDPPPRPKEIERGSEPYATPKPVERTLEKTKKARVAKKDSAPPPGKPTWTGLRGRM
eukprot:jgi/Mesvir1/10215/Mv08535-RA.1